MNIKRIEADLKDAKNNIYNNPTNDEYLYDISAYHTQQAIEKSLKYILHDVYGVDTSQRKYKTHNIPELIIRISEHDESFIKNHPDICEIAGDVTEWEATTRYGDDLIADRKEIETAIQYAEGLLNEIKEIEHQKNSIIEKENDSLDER